MEIRGERVQDKRQRVGGVVEGGGKGGGSAFHFTLFSFAVIERRRREKKKRKRRSRYQPGADGTHHTLEGPGHGIHCHYHHLESRRSSIATYIYI